MDYRVGKQNVKYKPFKEYDITLIIQFEFCPRCKYFSDCYELDEILSEYYEHGLPITVKGATKFISPSCGEDLEPQILNCKKCGSPGVLKSIANGNRAVLCVNKDCKNAYRARSGYKGSDRRAIDDWNRRNKEGLL